MRARPGCSLCLSAIAEQDIAGTAAEDFVNPLACEHAPRQLRGALLVVDDDGLVCQGEVGLDRAAGFAKRNAVLPVQEPPLHLGVPGFCQHLNGALETGRLAVGD